MLHCWNQACIPDCRLPWVFSKRKLFLMQGTAWRTTHLTISRAYSWLSDVQVSWSWHNRLRITFSNQRFSNCSPIVDARFVTLMSESFYANRSSRWILGSAVLLWFFETLLNIRRSLSVNADFCPLFIFADVVFPRFVYADITLETVALDTTNVAAVLSQMLQLNAHRRSVLFQIRQVSHFPILSRGLSLSTNTNTLTRALRECKQTEEHSVLPTEVLSM
jgi:hypothetical protein